MLFVPEVHCELGTGPQVLSPLRKVETPAFPLRPIRPIGTVPAFRSPALRVVISASDDTLLSTCAHVTGPLGPPVEIGVPLIRNPVALISPLTSSLKSGAVVPMPTLPLGSIRIFSEVVVLPVAVL